MSINFRRIKTTASVWSTIHKAHPELKVFGTYSAPGGDPHGNPYRGRMMTAYGFEGCDYPIVEAETTWDIDTDNPFIRSNEQHEYYLCVAREDQNQ